VDGVDGVDGMDDDDVSRFIPKTAATTNHNHDDNDDNGADDDDDDDLSKWLPSSTTTTAKPTKKPAAKKQPAAKKPAAKRATAKKPSKRSQEAAQEAALDDSCTDDEIAPPPEVPEVVLTGNPVIDDMNAKRAAKAAALIEKSKPKSKRAKKNPAPKADKPPPPPPPPQEVIEMLSSDDDEEKPQPVPITLALQTLLTAITTSKTEPATPLTRYTTVQAKITKKNPHPDPPSTYVSSLLMKNIDGSNGVTLAKYLAESLKDALVPGVQRTTPSVRSGAGNVNDVFYTLTSNSAEDYMLLEGSRALEPLMKLVVGLYVDEADAGDTGDAGEDECSIKLPQEFNTTEGVLTTSLQGFPKVEYSTIKPKWGTLEEDVAEAGREHPGNFVYSDAVLLVNLCEERLVCIDNGGCGCKLTGNCYCYNGCHYQTNETAPGYRDEKVEGEENAKLTCKVGGDCKLDMDHIGRCQSCKHVVMKSGDAILLDGSTAAKVITSSKMDSTSSKLECPSDMPEIFREQFKGNSVQLLLRVLQYDDYFSNLEKEVRTKLRELAYYGSNVGYPDTRSTAIENTVIRPFVALKNHYGLKIDEWDEIEHWNKDDAVADGFKGNAYKSDQLAKSRRDAGMFIDTVVNAAKIRERKTTLTRGNGSLWGFVEYMGLRSQFEDSDTIRDFTDSAEEKLASGEYVGEVGFDGLLVEKDCGAPTEEEKGDAKNTDTAEL
jgi:hypothetical protein